MKITRIIRSPKGIRIVFDDGREEFIPGKEYISNYELRKRYEQH